MKQTIRKLIISKNASLENLIDAYKKGIQETFQGSFKNLYTDILIFLNENIDVNAQDQVKSDINNRVFEIFEDKIGELKILPDESLSTIYSKFSSKTKNNIKKTIGTSFGDDDIKAIKVLEKRMVWVANDARDRTQKKLKQILADSFKGQYTKDEFFGVLRKNFVSWQDVTGHKLKAAADFNIRQNRNIATAIRAREYGTKYLRVIVKLDERTTNICRSMQNRLIPLAHISSQVDNIMDAKTVNQAKQAVDLSVEGKGVFDKKLPANVGVPPYHFGCRTILEEVANSLVSDYKVDRFNRTYQTGKTVMMKITKEHLNNVKYKSPEKMIADTLENIDKEGVHIGDAKKRVVLGKNKCVVFMDKVGNVESCYKPTNKAYFEKWAMQYFDSLENAFLTKRTIWLKNIFGE